MHFKAPNAERIFYCGPSASLGLLLPLAITPAIVISFAISDSNKSWLIALVPLLYFSALISFLLIYRRQSRASRIRFSDQAIEISDSLLWWRIFTINYADLKNLEIKTGLGERTLYVIHVNGSVKIKASFLRRRSELDEIADLLQDEILRRCAVGL